MRVVLAVFALVSCMPSLAEAPAEAPAAPPVASCPADAASETLHTFRLMGNLAGSQTTCRMADGSLEVFYAFNDRGRGPKLHSRIVLDERGIPRSIRTDGNDYLKSPVDERFERVDGKASWSNKIERGERADAASAFYLSQNGSYAEGALLAQALLAAPDHRLPVLPQGEAHLEVLQSLEVRHGQQAKTVRLVAIDGLGFNPVLTWLDAEGQPFAEIDSWAQLVLAGWEDNADALRTVQDEWLGQRRGKLAQRLQSRPAGGIAIEHALLFDSEAARMQPGMTVVVENNTIRAVGKDGAVAIPDGAHRIDAQGRALLPGLWDMHQHPDADGGALLLAAGITGVRDMAAEPQKRAQLAGFETGEVLGPRVVFAGIIDGKGPFQGPTRMLTDDAASARALVREIADAHFRQVKVYSSVKPELVPVIVNEAHARGLRVSGHIPAYMTAEQAVRAGYDEIQHMNMLFLNFLYDIVQDTRTPARFIAVAEHADRIDPASAEVRGFIELLRERHITIDPTLVAFEGLFCDRPGQVGAAFAADAARLPPTVRRSLMEGGLPVPEGQDARYRGALVAMQRMLLALYQAKVDIVAGTDEQFGLPLVRELELYVAAGIPANEVLRIATLRAAQVAGEGERLGVIAPGRLADLVLVDGDPVRNIADLRRLQLVIRDGALIDLAGLWRELGLAPAQGYES